jgi:O-antigen ligase
MVKQLSWLYLTAIFTGLGIALIVWILCPQQPYYALGVSALLGLLTWIAYRPLHGVFLSILAVGLLPQAPQRIGFFELAFLAILGTTLATWFFKGSVRRRLVVPAHPITAALIALFGVFLLSLPIALARGTTLYEWARGLAPFVPMLVFFVVATEARDVCDYRRLLWAFLVVGGWLAAKTVFTFWQERLWAPIFIPELGFVYRRITWLVDSSTSPLILAGALIALVEALFAKNRFKRLAFWVAALLLGGAVVLTLSRSEIAVLILTAVAIFFMLLMKGRLRLTRFALQIGLVGLLLSLVVLSSPLSPLWGLIQSRAQALVHAAFALVVSQEPSGIEDVNVLARLYEYSVALEAFREQPFVGQGIGYSYKAPFLEQDATRVQHVQYVHNIIAYFLMTTGLLGTSAFMVLALSALLAFWRKYLRETSLDRERILLAGGSALTALWFYALFFAAFRNLGFNLMVGVALALLATHRPVRV